MFTNKHVKLDFNHYDYIVINTEWGGFFLSEECTAALGIDVSRVWDDDIRTNRDLINLMLTKGPVWCGGDSLSLVRVKKGINWSINEYDGAESIVIYPDVETII